MITLEMLNLQLSNVEEQIDSINQTPANRRTEAQRESLKLLKKEVTRVKKEIAKLPKPQDKTIILDTEEEQPDNEEQAQEEQTPTTQGEQTLAKQEDQSRVGLTVSINVFDDNFKTDTFKAKKLNLVPEYWSPEIEGEAKTLIFWEFIKDDKIPDITNPGMLIEKDSCVFVELKADGSRVFLKCSSTRLVSVMMLAQKGEVFQVIFTGKKKNKSNNYMSNRFEIYPLEHA